MGSDLLSVSVLIAGLPPVASFPLLRKFFLGADLNIFGGKLAKSSPLRRPVWKSKVALEDKDLWFQSGGGPSRWEGHGPRSQRGKPQSTPGPGPRDPGPWGCGDRGAHTVPEGADWTPQRSPHASVCHLPPGRPPDARDAPPHLKDTKTL